MILPVLPIKNMVLYPRIALPLSAGRSSSLAAIESAMAAEDNVIVVVAQRRPEIEEPDTKDLFPIGTRGILKKVMRVGDQLDMVVQGVERVALLDLPQRRPFLRAEVAARPFAKDDPEVLEAMQRELRERIAASPGLLRTDAPNVVQLFTLFRDPLDQAYLVASLMELDLERQQTLLEADSASAALRLMLSFLTHEEQILKLRQKITSAATTEMSREQKDYFLRQQMRAIQHELGDEKNDEAEITMLREKAAATELPEAARKEVEEQLVRLSRLNSMAPDYQVTRSYIELILELPWNRRTTDDLDVGRARRVLDEDHYDLKEVKERIIEHLAVLRLNPKAKAPILCFVGAPGVGKTSLGQSIARALGRAFEHMSLGGLHDEAELRGHRRTYVGAMPGRIIQAVRRAGVNNPVLMLDEVDKIGRDFRGDPDAALMEVLDPAQNVGFRDNYLDLPFDLSRVFFITTANSLDTIPGPLLDRMELLRLAGYTDEEKLQIAVRYLLPRQLSQAGLRPDNLQLPDETIHAVIRLYTREAGVRQLDRALGQITRRVALRFAEGKTEAVNVAANDLAALLGPERFFLDQTRKILRPGVAAGLAWTEAGGEVLYVESSLLHGRDGLTMTGHLGEVMKESVQTAHSYILSHPEILPSGRLPRHKAGIHVHVPAGAVPKDGPSAGVAIAVALASLYSGLPARRDTAMTGEITLSGPILPVGGIKEKVLAAKRAELARVILPKANEKDLAELPPEARAGLELVFVEELDEALTAAIPGLARPLAAQVP
ncbi:MAG: endopeptidase La [Elusimicrobia bacterium]|nr:endopeptidase La [Elusimicrobiota bacterium]